MEGSSLSWSTKLGQLSRSVEIEHESSLRACMLDLHIIYYVLASGLACRLHVYDLLDLHNDHDPE